MEKHLVFDPNLTKADRLVLDTLAADMAGFSPTSNGNGSHSRNGEANSTKGVDLGAENLATLDAFNDPKSSKFEPTIFTSVDFDKIQWAKPFNAWVLRPYVRIAKQIVRVDTDVVMLTHLLLYFSTTVPSALILFLYKFTWIHAAVHIAMQATYMGTYTLMMHQHIHMRGILKKQYAWFDHLFPYILDPLHGHTWNSYFYHHVKHHHIEGNGPNDLSSTIRYQRDDIYHLLHYIGRFYFFIWADLPMYFLRKGKHVLAFKAFSWEISTYTALYTLFRFNPRAAFCVLLLPLLFMRLGLMVGNWGQHAFVDDIEPDSDYRSSVTLIDVQSNRYSYNDGYHTSHHLNPLRHWRHHPNHFLKQRKTYAEQHAIVFHNIDYIMITISLMLRNYRKLAQCMVPINEEQFAMTIEERMAYLQKHTRKFTEEEIQKKFKST